MSETPSIPADSTERHEASGPPEDESAMLQTAADQAPIEQPGDDDTELHSMSGPYRPAPSWIVDSWNRSIDRNEEAAGASR